MKPKHKVFELPEEVRRIHQQLNSAVIRGHSHEVVEQLRHKLKLACERHGISYDTFTLNMS